MKNLIYTILLGAVIWGITEYPSHNLSLMATIILWAMAILKFIMPFLIDKIMEDPKLQKYRNKNIYIRDSILKWVIIIYLGAFGFPVLATVLLIGDYFIYHSFKSQIWDKE